MARESASGHVAADDYLETTVRSWLGLRRTSPIAAPALPEPLARLLLRDEEHERAHRDQFGRWEFPFSENFHRGALWTPEIDEWAAAERRALANQTDLEPLWPDNHRFAVCLTHDVDMVSRQATPRQVGRSLWLGLTARGYRSRREQVWAARTVARLARFRLARVPTTATTLERCMTLEQEAGVRSSYFFTVYPDGRKSPYDCVYAFSDPCLFRGTRRRIAEVIRSIGDAGFDIGLHGGYHTALDGKALATEKEALEDAAGREVTTTRQHYLHWHPQVTPLLQYEAGLRTDSTLGFNRNVGFRAGTSLPFQLVDRGTAKTLDLLEVPLVLQDGALLAEHALALDAALAKSVIAQLFDVVANVNGVATILFHPHVLVRDEIADVYRWTIEYAKDHGAWIASLSDIDSWWRNRQTKILELPAGDGRRSGSSHDPI